MKKTLTVIATILLVPIVAAGFVCAIPAVAFYKGFEMCKDMIDTGRI